MGIGTPIWPIEGVALDSTGDEVAGSLGVVVKAIQTTQTSDSADITAIKAVTDVIPDAGALTVPTADVATNVDWGDVIGNKTDAASRTVDVSSLVALVREAIGESERHDEHFHNSERWWGAVAAPDETNAIESNVNRPFAATSGANTWGAAIPIVGTADNAAVTGLSTEFDVHEILISDLDDDTSPWKLRLIYGTGTSGDAITAGQCSERMVESNAEPGNRAGGTPVSFKMIVLDVGTKVWAQAWNDSVGEIASFFIGVHGYPAPTKP